jgi:hypothetical protein
MARVPFGEFARHPQVFCKVSTVLKRVTGNVSEDPATDKASLDELSELPMSIFLSSLAPLRRPGLPAARAVRTTFSPKVTTGGPIRRILMVPKSSATE